MYSSATWLREGAVKAYVAIGMAVLGVQLGSAACAARADSGSTPSGDPYGFDAQACAGMQGRRFGDTRIIAATLARPPYTVRWMGSTRVAQANVPFCRLEAYASPATRSHVGIEIWLPVRTFWNGRFLGVGAGGSMGDVNRVDMAAGVNRGFAVVATDNGHRSPGPRDANQWALGEPERIVDFGHRAQHVATMAGKAATRAFYGRTPDFSYFFGCSQGGQKGMMAAQRYPEDYDGIVAGAPVYSWANLMTQQAWSVRALTETPRSSLSVKQMQALQDAALKRCAAAHDVIVDPRQCVFDPAELACPRADDATCLLPEQVVSARKMYAGPSTSNGRPLHAGFARGGERAWEQLYGAVSADGAVGGGSWLGVYRYMALDDPTFTLPQLDFDRDPALAKSKLGPHLDSDDPDLDDFAKRGGKLIVFHGWSDQQTPAGASLDYRDAVLARSRAGDVDRYYRLFMVPGMPHCLPEMSSPTSTPPALGPNLYLFADNAAGVPFTPRNDALTALQYWVERDVAPESFDVRIRHDAAGLSARTVLSCAEPRVPRYLGNGDPLDPAHWRCENRTEGSAR